MGGQASKLREDLEATQRVLEAEKTRASLLQADVLGLRQELAEQGSKLEQRERELVDSASQCAHRLDEKEQEVAKALKEKEILEELRLNDAMIVKKLVIAVLQKPQVPRSSSTGAGLATDAGSLVAHGTGAAEVEPQLRPLLDDALARLAAREARTASLVQASRSDQRQELCRTLWLHQMCDASLTLRSANLMVLGGLRMPRSQQGRQSASGLSGGVGVLRRFGEEGGSDGRWTAVGGSLLWDARERELSALRFAMCGQVAPGQRVSVGFDHTGNLSGGLKSNLDAFTIHANGSIDLNRRHASRVGFEVSYDLD